MVPGVMVIQVAKNTVPQSLLIPGSNSKNIVTAGNFENNNILITFILDVIILPINIMIQRPKSSNSLGDNKLGSLGLRFFQNQTVTRETIIPTTICCRSTTPEITIQNINKDENETNDFLNTINLLK